MPLSGFEAYEIYQGIHLHFTNANYNYFLYNGKTKASKSSFETRSDKYNFYRLSRQYPEPDSIRDFFVANYFYRDIKWTGAFMTNEADEAYKEYLKRKQSITYTFEADIDKLLEITPKLDDLLKVKGGQYPQLLDLVLKGEITQETLIILEWIFGFMEVWEKKIVDEIVYPKLHQKCMKFKPFLGYLDFGKMKKILKKKLTFAQKSDK